MLIQVEIPDQPERYSEPAAHVVRELAESDVRLTLDDLAWLHQLGERLTNGPNADALARGIPARAANVWLWPFTSAGAAWYGWAIKNLPPNDELDIYIPVYALSQGRIPGAFDKMYDAQFAVEALKEWRQSYHGTLEELERAIFKVDPREDLSCELAEDKDKEQKPTGSYSDITATLVACCGGDPEMWETAVSQKYLLRQLEAVMQQRRAESGADGIDATTAAAEIEIARATTFLMRRGKDDG